MNSKNTSTKSKNLFLPNRRDNGSKHISLGLGDSSLLRWRGMPCLQEEKMYFDIATWSTYIINMDIFICTKQKVKITRYLSIFLFFSHLLLYWKRVFLSTHPCSVYQWSSSLDKYPVCFLSPTPWWILSVFRWFPLRFQGIQS